MPSGLFCILSLAFMVRAYSGWPYQSFKSVDFLPPQLEVTKSGAPLGDGYLVFNQLASTGYAADAVAMYIMDDEGNLIWNAPQGLAVNLQVQSYQGKPVLTYWATDRVTDPYHGYMVILDNTYTELFRFCPDYGNIVVPPASVSDCYIDEHETLITQDDTVMFSIYNATNWDLTSVGGSVNGWTYDCVVYEFDLATGEKLFEWSALANGVQITETRYPAPHSGQGESIYNPWEWLHLNSLQKLDNGDYLINSRGTSTTYRVNPQGEIIWRLEGYKGGNFTLPTTPLFGWHHTSRIYNETEDGAVWSCFNNFNSEFDSGTNPTTVMVMYLDYNTMTATLLDNFQDPADAPLYINAEGSHQILSNGNHVAMYGYLPEIKEFGPDGDVRMRAQWGDQNWVTGYRGFRSVWHGYPKAAPNVVIQNGVLYVSWNGATDVSFWRVYAWPWNEPSAWFLQGDYPKTGFETAIPLNVTKGYAWVEGWDDSGVKLGGSYPVGFGY